MKKAFFSLSLAMLLALPGLPALAAGLPEKLIPSGQVVGIRLNAGGVEITEVTGDGSPASVAGLKAGDIIVSLDGSNTPSMAELAQALGRAEGEVPIEYIRGGRRLKAKITPEEKDGAKILGIWARDAISGIGTVTFIDPESGFFGALGHSVTSGTSEYKSGRVHPVRITGIIKGSAGQPGQLDGRLEPETILGSVNENTAAGIFGTLEEGCEEKAIGVGQRSSIHEGSACILSGAGGKVKAYSAEITKVLRSSDGRDMMLTVTDPELLELTGGIVQGMSGSPIIQDGRLIGAVTHVLVSDSTKGYGISIEQMLGLSSAGEKAA